MNSQTREICFKDLESMIQLLVEASRPDISFQVMSCGHWAQHVGRSSLHCAGEVFYLNF